MEAGQLLVVGRLILPVMLTTFSLVIGNVPRTTTVTTTPAPTWADPPVCHCPRDYLEPHLIGTQLNSWKCSLLVGLIPVVLKLTVSLGGQKTNLTFSEEAFHRFQSCLCESGIDLCGAQVQAGGWVNLTDKGNNNNYRGSSTNRGRVWCDYHDHYLLCTSDNGWAAEDSWASPGLNLVCPHSSFTDNNNNNIELVWTGKSGMTVSCLGSSLSGKVFFRPPAHLDFDRSDSFNSYDESLPATAKRYVTGGSNTQYRSYVRSSSADYSSEENEDKSDETSTLSNFTANCSLIPVTSSFTNNTTVVESSYSNKDSSNTSLKLLWIIAPCVIVLMIAGSLIVVFVVVRRRRAAPTNRNGSKLSLAKMSEIESQYQHFPSMPPHLPPTDTKLAMSPYEDVQSASRVNGLPLTVNRLHGQLQHRIKTDARENHKTSSEGPSYASMAEADSRVAEYASLGDMSGYTHSYHPVFHTDPRLRPPMPLPVQADKQSQPYYSVADQSVGGGGTSQDYSSVQYLELVEESAVHVPRLGEDFRLTSLI